VRYQIVINAKADTYLGTLSPEVAGLIEDAFDALEADPSQYEAVQFKTAYLISVAGHDIAWTYSNNPNELIVASIRPFER
jgi:hypothetical protein